MINVYIVSGFLGSGKTTFIQKLLKEKKFERVMLLENEFGDGGFDSEMEYAEGLFEKERMEAFHDLYIQVLEALIMKRTDI